MLRHTPKLLNFMGFECSHGGSLGWPKSSKDCLRNGLMYTQLQGRSSNLFGIMPLTNPCQYEIIELCRDGEIGRRGGLSGTPPLRGARKPLGFVSCTGSIPVPGT